MTDAPSPPFALPLRHAFDDPKYPYEDWGIIRDARGRVVLRIRISGDADELLLHRENKTDPTAAQALLIIRAVNSYDKMRKALNDIEAEATALIGYEAAGAPHSSPDEIPNGLRTTAHIKAAMIRELARTILKEIDNG